MASSAKQSHSLAQERLRKAFIALMIALLIGLMITALAVMVQTGAISLSTWVLGNAAWLAFLSLAAKLGMMTLGTPALIALLVLSTWFIAGFVCEMVHPGFFARVLGLNRGWSSKGSMVFYVVQRQSQKLGNIDAVIFFVFILLTFPIGFLCAFALQKLGSNEATTNNPSDSGRRPAPIIALLWILNFIFNLLYLPFGALGIILTSIWTVMQAGWRGLKSLRSKEGQTPGFSQSSYDYSSDENFEPRSSATLVKRGADGGFEVSLEGFSEGVQAVGGRLSHDEDALFTSKHSSPDPFQDDASFVPNRDCSTITIN